MTTDRLFLDPAELRELTGYCHSARQVAQLRAMGIRFWVNAAGRPAVPRSAIEGGTRAAQPVTWEPAWAAARP